MAYAQVGDVEERFERTLDEDEEVLVQRRLDDAELLIKMKIPDLDAKVVSGEISEDLIVMIEADAVLALVRNPDAKVGETDGNYTYQINWATATGRLTIPDEHWVLLGVKKSVYTIAPKFYAIDELYGSSVWYPADLYPFYVGPPGGL